MLKFIFTRFAKHRNEYALQLIIPSFHPRSTLESFALCQVVARVARVLITVGSIERKNASMCGECQESGRKLAEKKGNKSAALIRD